MPRLQTINAGQHKTASAIGAEFENIVRYVNSAELGNKTLRELLLILFDEEGDFDGPIEMRLDTATGIQWRVGTFTSDAEGWRTIVTVDQLRGASGSDVGTIGGPLFYDRQDIVATASQTVFPYVHASTDQLMVWVNGTFQAQAAYAADSGAGTVTLATPANLNDVVTILKVRDSLVESFTRVDHTAATGQVVFPFSFSSEQRLLVYRNGILLREGGSNDYTLQPDSDTVTLMSTPTAGDIISIMTVDNTANANITGLMLADQYTDTNGYIPYSKLVLADGEVPASKINGLVTYLANQAPTYIQASAPSSPTSGSAIWLDTSLSPAVTKIWNGADWQAVAPDNNLPAYVTGDALKYLRINSSGNGLEWSVIDLSNVVPKTDVAAANGVASLDSTGRLPAGQLPDVFALESIERFVSGSVSNADYRIQRFFYQRVNIDGMALKLSAGTCDVQIKVDGVLVGNVQSVTTTTSDIILGTSIEIDASSASKLVEVTVTSASSASDLEVTLALSKVSA